MEGLLSMGPTPSNLVISTVKTWPVPKRAWQGLSNEGGTQWDNSGGHDDNHVFMSLLQNITSPPPPFLDRLDQLY